MPILKNDLFSCHFERIACFPIVKGIEELMAFCIEYEILASCQELKNIERRSRRSLREFEGILESAMRCGDCRERA